MFWAGYYGDKALVWKFMTQLGISPFMKIVQGKNVITACI